ncbi:ABC-type dipeptide transport system, periplasmic component [uncultured Sporomusa sp.]|uniref:ABC-type dipeptide transport system, periplasmic component n=1 Tax=uncultured Sporomusa sp. TaxID=307249 RepID=A0A212M050_9FIRM|nr:ABC transporter substrate-binding protein [uncultured Sporomusa sp.]SCM83235.1 ABC-type dipeptide transport system, periplasmic component [uncultured Sporomusa sp.]
MYRDLKSRLRKAVVLAIACCTMLLAGGCGTGENTGTAAETNKPLVINLSGGDSGLPSPYAHYPRGPGTFKMSLIFDSLLERGEQGYIPWLAEKWELSPDGKIYTFTLRQGVNWHDGSPLTAQDVKFTLEYFAKHIPVSNELEIDGKTIVEAAEVINDHTIKIAVTKPNATILGRLGTVRIIPKHIWEKVDDPKKFTAPAAVIGCGPYVLKEYHKEQGAYKFEAFAGYWGPKPQVQVLQFIPVSDSMLAFNKGEIDLTAVTADLLARYENNKEYVIKQNPAFWGYRLLFNMEKRPELKDKQVRQAFAHAINRQELVDKVARGAAIPASAGYLPASHIWYNQNVRQYDFNIEKAKELLQGKKLTFTLLISSGEARIAELMKISLAQAGIELVVRSVDGKTRDAAVISGDYELIINGHGGWGGDADLLRTAYVAQSPDQSPSSRGVRGYSNEAISTLCEQQLVEIDPAKRKLLIFRLQEEIAEEIPQIPLMNTTGYIVYRPAKYGNWRYMFDHHEVSHNKLSYLAVQ